MEVQELEQQASVVDQLWMRHQNEAVGGKHNGRMDEDDLGPETDVDSIDDVLLSPSIAAAKAVVTQAQTNTTAQVWPQEKLQKEQQMWLKTLPWSYADAVRKNPPKKQLIQEDVLKVDDKLEQEIQKDISPLSTATPDQPQQQQLDQDIKQLEDEKDLEVTAVIAKGEEIKNYVGDNEIDSGEESEEEWNYIPGKENPKENLNQIQQIQQELNAEDEEDMESQLNPNAAEFVPVFIPPRSAAALEKDVSSSPAKGAEQSLENIDVPTVNEFYCEISKRPSELESLNNDPNKSLNETTLNGVDITSISTKAVYGGDDSINFLSSVNNSTVANLGDDDDDEDEAIEVPLNDTNPFSPSHIPAQPNTEQADTIQEQMVQDHFSLGFKPFDPMTQSMTMMEDEGQHEDETSPDIDFMSSDKPDLLSPEINQPLGAVEAHEALEAQTSSSGFDSESGPDDGDHIPAEQCNLAAAAAAAVGISFGEDIDLEGIVNTKSMSMIDDSHPIEKIEQTISPSISPMPQPVVAEVKEDLVNVKEEEEEKKIKDEEKKPVEFKEEILTPLKDVDASIEPEVVQVSATTIETHVEEKQKVIEEDIVVKGISPQQLVDLVQELQFNQEPSLIINKHKEEEPESDSGFEIINASEAPNEPDLIENETSNKLQQNVEETSLVNGLVSNCVPDLLLQPSETEIDRQPSPVGNRTDNIIADIEGAMLDSSPPIIQTSVEESFTEMVKEPIEVPLVVNEDNVIIEERLELSKSPISFDRELESKSPVILDEELEESKMSVLIDKSLQESKSPVSFDQVVDENKPTPLMDQILEENKISSLTDQVLEDEREETLLDQDRDIKDSTVLDQDRDIKDSTVLDQHRDIKDSTVLDQHRDIKEIDISKSSVPVEPVPEVKEDAALMVEEMQDKKEIIEIEDTKEIKDMLQEIKEGNKEMQEVTVHTVTALEEKKQESAAVDEIKENIIEDIKTIEETSFIEQITKQIEDNLLIEYEEVIREPSPVKEKEDIVVEVIKETLVEVADNRQEELVEIQDDSKEKLVEPPTIVPEVKEETNKEVKEIVEVQETVKEQESQVLNEQKELVEVPETIKEQESQVLNEQKELVEVQETIKEQESQVLNEQKELVGVEVKDMMIEPTTVDEDKEVLPSQPTPPTTPAPGVTEEDNKPELIAAAIAAAGVAAGVGVAKAVSAAATPKVEEKPSTAVKKPTGSGAPSPKKAEGTKASATKTSIGATKPPASKASTPASAAAKKTTTVGSTAKPSPKSTSAAKPSTPSSKPSSLTVATSKTAPGTRPSSAKPSTPTTKTPISSVQAKTPPKPRTPTSAKPLSSTTSSIASKAPGASTTKTTKTSVPATTGKPSTTTAPKKPEPAPIKRSVPGTTAAKPMASGTKTAAPSKTTSIGATKPATKMGPTTVTKSLNVKPPASAATKTSATSSTKPLAKAPVPGKPPTAAKAPVPKAATRPPTATKAPIPKAKPAAPTAIKKPTSADKNIKDATNNKLSAAKQAGAIKKQEVITKQDDTKPIEPLTQEPTVSTTNGHIENGISNEDSSPVDIAPFPQIVQALN